MANSRRYIQRTDYQAAIEPFLKVIELGGSDAQSYGLLAYAYLNQEKYESSLSAYRMARMFDLTASILDEARQSI